MGPKWAKHFTEISHKKRIRSTQRSVYLYEPYFLFSVFWHIFYFLYSDLAAAGGTGPPKIRQFLQIVWTTHQLCLSNTNQPVQSPPQPPPLGHSPPALITWARYQTPRDSPYAPEPAEIILQTAYPTLLVPSRGNHSKDSCPVAPSTSASWPTLVLFCVATCGMMYPLL